MNISLVIIFLFVGVVTVLFAILFVMRFDAVKSFLKQFILLEDIDDKTDGILEHEMVLELLKREVAKSERYNFPVSLMFLDISDAPKKANFLEKVQDTVKRSIRETDVFGFLGPEADNRFICVLPHTKFDAAYDMTERLRVKLNRRLSLDDDTDLHLIELGLESSELDVSNGSVSVSCGVSELEQFEDVDSLLDRVVKALETAKDNGGHCTMPKPVIKDVIISDVPKHLN